MAARKGDLVLYSGDIFPTETRKLPSCPRSHSVNRKGKPTHLSAPLVDRCGFTKRLSTVHSRKIKGQAWWGRSIQSAIFLA
ncbi:hypothetical protein P3L10_031287 [Capsicum annuum]